MSRNHTSEVGNATADQQTEREGSREAKNPTQGVEALVERDAEAQRIIESICDLGDDGLGRDLERYLTNQAERIKTLEEALRAFPQFDEGREITADAIKAIAREYHDMVVGWEPAKSEIEFLDHDGNTHRIVYEAGDFEHGPASAWVLEEGSALSALQGGDHAG